jgi:hypothetical protein
MSNVFPGDSVKKTEGLGTSIVAKLQFGPGSNTVSDSRLSHDRRTFDRHRQLRGLPSQGTLARRRTIGPPPETFAK